MLLLWNSSILYSMVFMFWVLVFFLGLSICLKWLKVVVWRYMSLKRKEIDDVKWCKKGCAIYRWFDRVFDQIPISALRSKLPVYIFINTCFFYFSATENHCPERRASPKLISSSSWIIFWLGTIELSSESPHMDQVRYGSSAAWWPTSNTSI